MSVRRQGQFEVSPHIGRDNADMPICFDFRPGPSPRSPSSPEVVGLPSSSSSSTLTVASLSVIPTLTLPIRNPLSLTTSPRTSVPMKPGRTLTDGGCTRYATLLCHNFRVLACNLKPCAQMGALDVSVGDGHRSLSRCIQVKAPNRCQNIGSLALVGLGIQRFGINLNQFIVGRN